MKQIIANWKNYPKSFKEVFGLAEKIERKLKEINNDINFVLCPPGVFIRDLAKEFPKINFGSQNLFWEEKKICTGEISGKMLKDLGCKFAIVGHSERRNFFKESDEIINKKIKICLSNKIIPIFCVGETFEENKNQQTFSVLKKQIESGLKNINLKNKEIFIAYEPIWSIGTGKVAQIEVLKNIRDYLKDIANLKGFNKVKIIYGGSVDAKNVAQILNQAGFDGLLIGKNSFNFKELEKILNNI
ncbi:MAG: triose-phosphate isomerase [bacterium]|nr:triose-phosphate isomerase [bacterium]